VSNDRGILQPGTLAAATSCPRFTGATRLGVSDVFHLGVTNMSKAASKNTDARDDERGRVADEMAARLRQRGVRLSGHETGEDLANLLEAVEEFEGVVQNRGGDLMVDEPVAGDRPILPDDRAFVLPVRGERETVSAFIGHIAEATARARHVHGRS
jgi:hypothetical protein